MEKSSVELSALDFLYHTSKPYPRIAGKSKSLSKYKGGILRAAAAGYRVKILKFKE